MNSSSHWHNFIAGQWQDSAEHIDVYDPATAQVFATTALASEEQVESAMTAARAFVSARELVKQRPVERSRLLYRISEELLKLVDEGAILSVSENGKTLNDAKDEFVEAARYFEYYAGMADKIEGKSIPLGDDYVDFTVYEPVGVSLQIVPWNFPVSICARSLAPALAAGNAVVVKSPEVTPVAITLIAKACEKAGLPAGALSILCGYGHSLGAQLVSHPEVDQIVFTGSVATGQAILRSAAERAIPTVMELGGKSAAVVFPDVNIPQLLTSIKWGIYFNAGQVCSAMSRLLVHEDVYDQVVEAVAHFAKGLGMGRGCDNAQMTPLTSLAQQTQVLRMCEEAEKQGATLITGGKIPEDQTGYFFEATIFADVDEDMDIFRDEVFGPVLCISKFKSEEQAYQMANNTDYGLVAGVFTQDINRALRASKILKAGQVFVNEWYAGGIETPFGGTKLSGFGREKGQEALYSYVQTKNIAIRLT